MASAARIQKQVDDAGKYNVASASAQYMFSPNTNNSQGWRQSSHTRGTILDSQSVRTLSRKHCRVPADISLLSGTAFVAPQVLVDVDHSMSSRPATILTQTDDLRYF